MAEEREEKQSTLTLIVEIVALLFAFAGAITVSTLRVFLLKGWSSPVKVVAEKREQRKAVRERSVEQARNIAVARRVLSEVFDDPKTIRIMLLDVGMTPSRFELAGSVEQMWDAALREASKQSASGIRRLLIEAQRRYPSNSALTDILERFPTSQGVLARK